MFTKLKAKKSEKKLEINRMVSKTGIILFLQGGSFLFLNQSFSLSMSKFLHLLFSLVISYFKK